MLNIFVTPLMLIVGALTANLSTMIRGESKLKLNIGMKTFVCAATAFASVWFALLVTAIYTGGDTNTLAGVEVLMLFLTGLIAYRLLKLDRFITASVQLWLFRLALPLILFSCWLVMMFG